MKLKRNRKDKIEDIYKFKLFGKYFLFCCIMGIILEKGENVE